MDTPAVYDQGLIEPANGDAPFIINNDDVIASQWEAPYDDIATLRRSYKKIHLK